MDTKDNAVLFEFFHGFHIGIYLDDREACCADDHGNVHPFYRYPDCGAYIALSFVTFQPITLIFLFMAFFIQSSAEELLCRGFLYQRLLKSYGKPMVAIVGNALQFAWHSISFLFF